MKAAGIICEYNPFHAGHKKQIDFLRSQGYDCIVCVMSGNYTQRGEPAIYDKYARAEAAIIGGADLVLELPYPYSSLSAEGFARAGISILENLSDIDAVCFGHECDDPNDLFAAAKICASAEFAKKYAELAKHGGGARAFFDALASLGCEAKFSSNDILGISYIKALNEAGSQMAVLPIKREGTAYKSEEITDEHNPSASGIRKLIFEGNVDFVTENMVPKGVQNVLKKYQNLYISDTNQCMNFMLPFFKFNSAELIRIRAMEISGRGSDVYGDGGGLLERFCSAAASSGTLREALDATYGSSYTDARVRRMMLAAYFGITEERADVRPKYTTLLAASSTGRELMAGGRKTRCITIVTKPADAPYGAQRRITTLSDEVYAYAMSEASGKHIPHDYFIKCKPYMAENSAK